MMTREKKVYIRERNRQKKGGGRTIAMKRKGSVDNVRYVKKRNRKRGVGRKETIRNRKKLVK